MSLRSDTLRITKVSKVSVSKVSFVILRHYFASEGGAPYRGERIMLNYIIIYINIYI